MLAQPNSGFKGGINWTFHSNTTYQAEYSPELGWQFGYAWNIKVHNNLSINTELMIDKYAFSEKWYNKYNDIYLAPRSEDTYYLTVPLGLNYLIYNKYYVSSGYQISYTHLDLISNYWGPQWAHAAFLGGGFHLKYFDLTVKYVYQFNEEKLYFDGGKNNTIQTSIIVPLKWRD